MSHFPKREKNSQHCAETTQRKMIVALEHIILHLPHVFDAAELRRDELAWISGLICQTDPDKLRHTAATHICIRSLVICPSIEFAKFPIIHPPVNMRIALHEYHHQACSEERRVDIFFHIPQECYRATNLF